MRNIPGFVPVDPKKVRRSGEKPVDVPGRTTHVYASCGTSETASKDAMNELSVFGRLRFAAGATRREHGEDAADMSVKRVRRATKPYDADSSMNGAGGVGGKRGRE